MKFDLRVLYNLNIKEKLIIAVVILFIVGYVIYSLIIPPALYHYKIAKRQLYVQKHFIDARENKIKVLLRLKNNFEDLKRKSLERKRMFFTEEEALDFLNILNSWTKEAEINLQKIKPKFTEIISDSELEEERCYKNNIVEVTMRGKYNNLLRLFERFAGYEKLLGVSRIDLKHTKEGPLLLDAKVILNIYILDKK